MSTRFSLFCSEQKKKSRKEKKRKNKKRKNKKREERKKQFVQNIKQANETIIFLWLNVNKFSG